MDHKSHEAMRAYLLGLLSDDQAARLEEEYFVNRAFFLQVRSEEEALIADYLEGRLRGREKQGFEERYLKTPELRSKVEDAGRQRASLRPVARPPLWRIPRFGIAAAFMLLLGVGFWLYYSRVKPTDSSAPIQGANSSNEVRSPGSELAIFLSPGVTKGAGSVSAHFAQPATRDTIKLILELPGESSPAQRTVQIFMLKPDGTLDRVWTSPQPVLSALNYGLRSGAANSSDRTFQALTVPLPGSLFQPGDYLAEAWTTDRKMHETYEYRVTDRQ